MPPDSHRYVRLIVDNSVDVLMWTESWLYSHGDEVYIAAMTPAGYKFRLFLRAGSKGGGVGFCHEDDHVNLSIIQRC